MIELIKDILHAVGLHRWYVSPRGAFMHGHRACVRCGIVQVKGTISKKWRTIE
jgi:hypothetical protein